MRMHTGRPSKESNGSSRFLARVRFLAHELHVKEASTVVLGTVISQGMMIVSLPILTRLYNPESFGSYALISSIAAVVVLLGTLDLAGAIPTMATAVRASRFASVLIFLTLIVMCLGLLLAVVLLATHARAGTISPNVAFVAIWGAINGLSFALIGIMRGVLVKLGRFWIVATSACVRSLGFIAVAIGIGWWTDRSSNGGQALALGAVLGDFLGVVVLCVALTSRQRKLIAPLRIRRVIGEAHRQSRLLAAGLVSHSLNLIIAYAPLWIIIDRYGDGEAGLYALAYSVILAPTTIIGSSVGSVLSRYISSRHHRGDAIGHSVLLVVAVMSTLGAIGFALITAAALVGTGFAFGATWAQASNSIALLSILGYFLFIISAIGFLPLLLGLTRFLSGWAALRALLLLALVIWPAGHRWGYHDFLQWFVATQSFTCLIFIVFVLLNAFRCSGRGIRTEVAVPDQSV
jgi:O-antigen/teichoic acid export membrane protein